MDSLAKKLNIKQSQDWCSITTATLKQHRGDGLRQKYVSIGKLLTTLYPEYKLMCKQFIADIVHDLKLSKIEDVLSVSLKYPIATYYGLLKTDIKHLNCYKLLQQYDYSVSKCTHNIKFLIFIVLANCFPELQLKILKKQKVAKDYWKNMNNQRIFLEKLALILGIIGSFFS